MTYQYPHFIRFLKDELRVSEAELAVILDRSEPDPSLLSMTLWRYGFVTIEQLDRIFNWLALT